MSLPPLRLLNGHWPSLCRVCGAWPARSELGACHDCLSRWAQAVHRCLTCACRLSPPATRCGACLRQPPPLNLSLAAVDYAFPWSHWAIALKHESQRGLARAMGAMMVATWRRHAKPADVTQWLWTGVPMHPRKWRQRGFNPAWTLAQAGLNVGDGLAHRRVELLQRLHWRLDQHQLPLARRAAEVADAFALHPGAHRHWRPNQGVVLVDDVMTTGATLHACARAIATQHPGPIVGLVFARTPARSG